MKALPRPAWSQHHAVNPDLSRFSVLGALQSGMRNSELRHRSTRHKVVVSAVVLITKLAVDERQLNDILRLARLLTRDPLGKEDIAYAVMLLIFGGDSRASRQMASEYGRAARTLVDEEATDAAVAFERLEAEGIKRLARSTAVPKSATQSDQVRRTLISSSERAKRLSAVPAGQHIRITGQVMAAPKGRPALRLVRVHSVVPAPTGPTLSDKPTVTSDKQIRKIAPKWMP